jgi:putative oxidoreductase
MKKICNQLLNVTAKLGWLPPLLGRITVGVIFAQSGWGKLHNLPKVIDFFIQLGIPAPHIQAPFVATVELVCGLMVLFGIFTRLASIPLICTMIVAILTAKMSDISNFTDVFGLMEFGFIVILVWLVIDGPGCVSVDSKLKKKCFN